MAQRARRDRSAQFSSAVIDPAKSGRGGRVAPRDAGDGTVVWTHTNTQSWQHEAWQYEGDITELRQALNWQAAAASRAHLYACEREPDGTPGEPTTNPKVRAATDLLLDRLTQPGWLYTAVYNLALAGDMFVYGASFDGKDEYRIVSTEDVQRASTRKVTVKVDDRQPRVYDPSSELLIRVWWPHPRHSWLPTSPVKSALPVLCDIWKLTRLISSVADSRMRGAGLLLLSSKLTVPGADPTQPKPSVAQLLLDVASKALQDPDSAAAHVPVTLEGDLDAAEKIAELINLGVDFPKLLDAQLTTAIRRFALGQPIPAGLILGEEANHWNEFHREDEAVKMAIAPLVWLLASGLAESWLPAVLTAAGIDPTPWTLGVDMTAVEQRPDNSQRALEVYKVGELSGEALRRETGFGEDDAPDMETIDGELVDEPPAIESPERRVLEPVGPPEGGGDQSPPQPVAASALAAAARVAAVSALTRTGNRIKGRTHSARRTYADVPAHTIHTVASPEERAAVVNDDPWPDGVLDVFGDAAEAAGYDRDCACFRLQARVGQATRNGAALASLPLDIDFEACRDDG